MGRISKQAQAAKDREALSQAVNFQHDGESYSLRLGDVNAVHAMRFRRETGMAVEELFGALEKSGGLFEAACTIWLAKLVGGDPVPFEEFAATVNYSTVSTMSAGDADDSPLGDGPETDS